MEVACLATAWATLLASLKLKVEDNWERPLSNNEKSSNRKHSFEVNQVDNTFKIYGNHSFVVPYIEDPT